jgi:ketosteroid isomerase-like protein
MCSEEVLMRMLFRWMGFSAHFPLRRHSVPTQRGRLSRRLALGWLMMAVVLGSTRSQLRAQVSELDAYWTEVTRTVEEGDFEGYAALYHPDAVLVSLSRDTSLSIAAALDGWKQDFVATAEGRAESTVEFRFSRRLNDETTAHETGIFRYSQELGGAEPTVGTVHFEALLVKRDGNWLMMMEFQKEPATEAEWMALR